MKLSHRAGQHRAAPTYRVRAFRRAAQVVGDLAPGELDQRLARIERLLTATYPGHSPGAIESD